MPQHQAARSRGADRVEPRRLVSLAELDAVGEAQGHEPVLCRKRRRVWNISSKAESPSGLGVAPPAGRPAATPVSSPVSPKRLFPSRLMLTRVRWLCFGVPPLLQM